MIKDIIPYVKGLLFVVALYVAFRLLGMFYVYVYLGY